MEIFELSVSELLAAYRDGSLSPVDAIDALESRIQSVDPAVQAYLSRDFSAARAAAASADISLPLGGVPVGIKDVINVLGEQCTAGSKILESYRAPYDATVITKLRAAGAIPFGRLNMDEFAMGSSTENSAYQLTRNPWDLSRIPGGSSGGSAAAVAAQEAFATLGSDTGGSIRQPAALCGCVGLKPSYGRVSRYGLVAYASSLDQIGPFTKTTRDAALLLNAIVGKDAHDSTSLDQPMDDATSLLGRDLTGLKLGIPKEYFVDGMDSQVRAAVEAAIRQCESLGAELVEISLPHTECAVGVYYIVATAEASANLAR
ncbi:MAG: amidase, partial [Chthoniobacterales bacterium]